MLLTLFVLYWIMFAIPNGRRAVAAEIRAERKATRKNAADALAEAAKSLARIQGMAASHPHFFTKPKIDK